MDGVEQTSTSGFEVTDNGSDEQKIAQVLDISLDNLSPELEALKKRVQIEWLGTSTFFLAQNIEVQEAGHLQGLIAYRKALVHDISISPYDPSFYIDLSSVDSKLGFTDIGAANAHRCLVLIEAALKVNTFLQYPRELGILVHEAISRRLGTDSPMIIADEVTNLHLQAYQELVNGLLGCGALWDGLVQAKAGLKRFPRDPELLEMQGDLKTAFLARHNGLKEILDNEKDILASTRTGKIYQKKYPWMNETLYKRTPSLVRHINTGIAANRICEVKPVVFGLVSQPSKPFTENEDVGPLGLFATRDIKMDEKILVDHCVTGISDISPAKLQHCEACHAALIFPYMGPSQIIRPTCCKSAAFCSRACQDTALAGYHSVTCTKSFDWLFQNQGLVGKAGCGARWRTIMFLRVIAVVLADAQGRAKKGEPAVHPLQHPLIARMAANYPPADQIQPEVSYDWQNFENVVAPTRILMQLGINIFTDPNWTPEVVQTIFWRIENNANMGKTNLTGRETVMVNINPNYLFFNHSCEPNVSWHGAVPSGDVSIKWLEGMNGEILKPGCSAVWCIAARDIKKGEELKISYVGNPLGSEGDGEDEEGRPAKRAWLEKWFDRGCGCRICDAENVEIDRLEVVEAERQTAMGIEL
ncbi:hypothetical protein N431DRAFT_354695 [Stipitochalara longipes BDJ]|nr:hypothetical protein N431DRAFT_354695 [Stipitochalara longipes BDJ]